MKSKVSNGQTKRGESVTLADLIENYIKQRLLNSKDQSIAISRAQLAEQFRCVPSQINYVLTTRFTIERGYIIESRRGGGGYIRIFRLDPKERENLIVQLFHEIGQSVSEAAADNFLDAFLELSAINRKQVQLIRAYLKQEVVGNSEEQDRLRASLLKAMIFVVLNQ